MSLLITNQALNIVSTRSPAETTGFAMEADISGFPTRVPCGTMNWNNPGSELINEATVIIGASARGLRSPSLEYRSPREMSKDHLHTQEGWEKLEVITGIME